MTQWRLQRSFYEVLTIRQDGEDWAAGMTLAAYLNTTSYLSTRISWQTVLRLREKRGHADDIGLSYLTLTIFSDEHIRKEAVD